MTHPRIARMALARIALARTAVALAALAFTACTQGADDPPADLIITNAAVYTLAWNEPGTDGAPAEDAPFDSARGWYPDAEAVAVRGGRITFVGTNADAMRLRGSATRTIDAKGAALLPGLVDSHVHLANLGASLRRVNLVGVTTEEEAVRRVEERARTTPPGEWIVGYGWDEGAWANHYPDRRLLSARVPNHPVWLSGLHSFAGWANQMALDRAGVTGATTPPDGGEIRKDAAGAPSGLLLNNAVRLVESAIPLPASAEMDARMTAALEAMSRAGYSAVHDADTDSTMLASLQRLESANTLPVRVVVYLSARDSTLVRQWLRTGPDTGRTSMLRVIGVKAYYDGALGSRGALLLAPYRDRPAERGRGGAEYGFNSAVMTEAAGSGFSLMIHAIGDRANRETLDFLAGLFSRQPSARNGRHRVEHAQVLAPTEIARFAEHGVIASMQPGHAVEDKAWAEDRVGPERIRGAYAWRSLRTTGARMVFSSDMPGSNHDPFYMLHAAVTRRDPKQEPSGGWFPAERLTPEEAVRGYTVWAAYAAGTEAESGRITVGRWADLTLLDRDPFSVGAKQPAALLGGKAVATVVAGKVVFDGTGAR